MKKNYLLFSLLLLAGIFNMATAQSDLPTLTWNNQAPKQYPGAIVALGDDGYLYLNATLYKINIVQPRIEVVLPKGIDFVGTTKATILTDDPVLTPTASFGNPTLTGTEAAGNRKLVIYYIANSNTLKVGDSLVMKLNIRATCNVDILNPGNFDINIYAGDGAMVMGGYRNFQANIQKPTMRLFQTPGYETINFAQVNDTEKVSLDFDAQNGYVTSTYITLTYNGSIIYLSNFKINGTPLNLLTANSGIGVYHNSRVGATPNPNPAATSQITYIRLDQSVLGRRIDNIVHTLTFDASSNLGCTQLIGTAIRNNLTSNCEAWTGNQIILSLPGTNGGPSFSYTPIAFRQVSYFDFNNPNNMTPPTDPGIAFANGFCWDGVTPNYGLLVFTNNNGIATSSFSFLTEMNHGANQSRCEYIDTTKVYYRVSVRNAANTGDSIVTPLTRIPGNFITGYANEYGSNPAIYDPILFGKARVMTLSLPINASNPLPPNAKVEVQWAVYANPNWIVDAYRARASYTTSHISYNNISYRWDALNTVSMCGQSWTSGNVNIYNSSILYKPRFISSAQNSLTVFPEKPFTYSNQTYTGNNNTTSATDPAAAPTGARYAEYFVKMPAWLDLDLGPSGTVASAFTIGTTAPGDTGIYHGSSGGYKIYSVKYFNAITGLLNINMKPSACTTDCTIITDSIQVWADWISGSPTTPCHARFYKTSKIFSQINLNCHSPAIVIEDFGVYRQTRGWKDSNNDKFPDDGTLALDNEIQHWHFAQYDTGYYYIKGYIGGAATVTWDKLQAILTYRTGGPTLANYQYKWGTTGNTTPFWNQATMELKKQLDGTKVTFPLNIPTVTNQDSLIVNYDGFANDYQPAGGDSLLIKIPFVVTNGLVGNADYKGSIDVRTYGSKQSTPECTGLYSVEPFKVSYKGLNTGNAGSSVWTFNFPAPCVTHVIGKNPAGAGYPNSPNYPSGNTYGVYAVTYPLLGTDGKIWDNEVRNLHKLLTVTMRVPAGFYRTQNYFDFSIMKAMDRVWNPNIPLLPTSVSEDFATHDSIFVFDMSQVYDYEWNGSQPGITYNTTTGQLSNGKYPIGDDGAGASFVLPLLSTPGVVASAPTLGTTFTFITQYGILMNQAAIANNLNYTGPRLDLQTAPKTIYVNSQQLSISSAKIQSNQVAKNVWFYLKGNVENAYLILDNDTAWGQGINNCWVKAGDMAANAAKNYRLNFSYKGKTTCTNDTIALYTAFDSMNEGFIPDVSKPIDSVNVCRRGSYQYTILDVITPKTKVAGSIVTHIPNFTNPTKAGTLHYKDAFAVDYLINGKVSQGALNDPYVIVQIPEGQVYTDTTSAFGLASFEYPEGSGFRPIPPAVRNAMKAAIGETSDASLPRSFEIHAKDLLAQDPFMLPGWGADPTFGFTDLDRMFTIRIPFVPVCQTDLTGLRFRGNYYGIASCGTPCEDNGMQYISPTIYTDVYPEYSFIVKLSNINVDSRIFAPDKTMDTLVASFKKDVGALVKPIVPTDYVQLRLPKDITINGTITSPQFGVINVQGSSVNSYGETVYKLDLPAQQLNDSLAVAKDSVTFTYKIPVLYTPDPANDCSSPRQEAECQAVTIANFDESECPPRPLSLGSGSLLMLILNFDNPYACLNMPASLSVTCGGVTPVWFRDLKGTGGQLLAGNPLIYTPTVQKDTSFYIRGVYDYGGDNEADFGMVPVKLRMYPEVKANFRADTVCLGVATPFTDLSTIGGISSNASNTASWQWFLDGQTVAFDNVQNPVKLLTAGNHSVKLLVTSTDGCIHETTKSLYVRPYPTPAISGSMDGCFNDCAVYKTEKGMSNYTWTVDNGTISSANGLDSIKVCWNVAYSPTRGHVKVTYTDIYGCPSVETDSTVVVRQIPAVATISGDDYPCVNTNVVYSFVAQPGVTITNYVWGVKGGDIVAGGAINNPTVTINWKDVGNQQITLFVSNPTCSAPDTGKFVIHVQGPERPLITGPDSLCTTIVGGIGADPFVYQTKPGMNNYTWNIEGGVITLNNNNQITVKWSAYGIGKLTVAYDDGSCSTFMLDTFKVKVLPCQIIECSAMSNKLVEEDAYLAGFYTHNDHTWDAVPYVIPAFDSVSYFVEDTPYSSGPAATLMGAQFVARITSSVKVVVYFGAVTDTCDFTVTVERACPPTIPDGEGHIYKVTKLARLCWTENLRSTLYPDGVTPIPFAKPYACPGCPTQLDTIFGLLYSWYSAMGEPAPSRSTFVQGICPNGWHIPSQAEWELLSTYDAKQLMSTQYWLDPPGNGTDNFGFTALPAGKYEDTSGRFIDIYGFAGWWATEANSGTASYFEIAYYCSAGQKKSTSCFNGLSVRCVAD